jgi:predicted RNA methylase
MGWGILTIAQRKRDVIIEIKNPPYGLQKEKDNWNFLVSMIEGYLWNINKNFKTISVKENFKYLRIRYGL